MLHIVAALTFAAGTTVATPDSAELRREDLMAALRNGGYTVVLRHARTDRSFQEEMGAVPKERSQQRNLSDDGFRDAALMGVVFRRHGISFAEILSSPMYRCTETAEMAAGKPTSITMALRVFPTTAEQGALVKTPPKRGTNRLIVTHHFVIETYVPTISPGEIAESEAAVIRHTADGGVELVGRITLDDWSALANPGHRATPAAPTGTNVVSSAAIPDTHAGHLARVYIEAFNSGSAESMRAFLDAYMVADPARPTDERLKSYAKLFEDHGPLSLTSVDSSAALQVVLGMKSRAGNLRLTVKASEASPMRVSSVTFAYLQGGHR
jgi:phosphohistidine phosphatase SixA